jgi:signal transduction histidine kinase
MRNLITNAIKFTPDGGHVYVTSEPKTGRVELEVRDTGIGISADEQNAVFEKFYEVRDHLNHNSGTFDFKGGGLGLGLSTVKAILNAHGSGISLKSEPGKGSSFSFCLDSA